MEHWKANLKLKHSSYAKNLRTITDNKNKTAFIRRTKLLKLSELKDQKSNEGAKFHW